MLGREQGGGAEGAWIFEVPAVLFVTSMATFVRSYVLLKLALLALFMMGCLVQAFRRNRVDIHPRILVFYVITSLICIVWSVVGLFNPGSYPMGVVETLRLYVLWSAAFLILYTLLRSGRSLKVMHRAFVLSGILIALINFAGLLDGLAGLGWIPGSVRAALMMNFGIHEGYVQITSHNIGMLFVIVPYLLSLQLRTDAGEANSGLAKLSLVLSLILTAVSGRRALWIAVGLTPLVVLVLSLATGTYGRLRVRARRILVACGAALVIGVAAGAALPTSLQEFGVVQHVQAAFSAEDERTIQKGYLLDAFASRPMLGSGFGAFGGYSRNEDRPWIYELTYHQLLFNMGAIGVIVLGALFGAYLVLLGRLFRLFPDGSAVPFGLLTGFVALLIGSYSNPYLGSFDYLFFIGLLPFLTTFQRGFDDGPEEPGGPVMARAYPDPVPRGLR